MASSSDDGINIRFRAWDYQRSYRMTVADANPVCCEDCGVTIRYQYGPPPKGAFCTSCGLGGALRALKKAEDELPRPEWGEVCP